MSRRTRRLIALPALVSVVLLLCSCQPMQAPQENGAEKNTHSRPATDALDLDTADARKARISNLEYNALIDIAASDDEIIGELRIEFDLSEASSDLTLDFTGGTIDEMTVDSKRESADYNGYFITIPAEQLQLGSNVLEFTYRRPYGHDGTGLHRFIDPEDGRTYMHSYLWPYYANRVLPSFDQPSLKANFSLQVKAPKNWTVVSMSPGTATLSGHEARLWTFTKTPKIASYMFSLHAGEYKVWSDNSGDVPLRLMARQSLAQYVAVDEWF